MRAIQMKNRPNLDNAITLLTETFDSNFKNKVFKTDGNASSIACAITLGALAICQAIVYHADALLTTPTSTATIRDVSGFHDGD
jgi:hypothetical protein